MNKFKQEWSIDFVPRRMTQTIIQRQDKPTDAKPFLRKQPDSEALTDQHVKITVKA
jgi:hypothetical protein